MFLRVNICSVQDLPAGKEDLALLSAMREYCSNIVDKIVPRIDHKQIPLQLLQSVRLPFYGNLTIMPLLHSSETILLLQHVLNKVVSVEMIV